MEQQETGYFERTEQLVRRYLEDRVLLLKLTATEKIARLAAALVIFMVVLLLGFFLLLLASILAGYFFARVTGSIFYGFGIVTGFYLILLVLVLALRKRYLDPFITNTVVRIFFDKSEDDNGEQETQA
ncbi:phage holin family protein [Flavihumibacter petaseus]|uniref:Phage holin family protein n=1 Tax=Flavihumibacter petaseus NBRC 106054 TaxID=1220578 RepID=A0A0E9N4U2_9BACT|nr:phage holin family protein [Flavihumibacter petaseus]GAO44972.1 hypothetical protein FPE01S_04_02150 [Flavihumibacter petaseus NBRC 106054]